MNHFLIPRWLLLAMINTDLFITHDSLNQVRASRCDILYGIQEINSSCPKELAV